MKFCDRIRGSLIAERVEVSLRRVGHHVWRSTGKEMKMIIAFTDAKRSGCFAFGIKPGGYSHYLLKGYLRAGLLQSIHFI